MTQIRHFTATSRADIQRAITEAGGPLADLQAEPDRMDGMSLACVEVDGQIVAYWLVCYALHVEPLWVAEAFRKNPPVIKGIVAEMQRIVEGTGEPAAFCVIDQENLDHVAPYANRLGFHEAPGKLFYAVVNPPAEEKT